MQIRLSMRKVRDEIDDQSLSQALVVGGVHNAMLCNNSFISL